VSATATDQAAERADRAERLAALVGKRALVGITLLDAGGGVVRQFQVSGLIVAATLKDGIDIEQDENAGTFNLPPDPGAFHAAPPAHYRLRATGRVVVDPDLLSTWDFHQPPDG
jgi:hypothetical protein